MGAGHAVVMFTDVVGSTEMSQRLAPDDAHELHREHFAILRQALAETGGVEVKHLGDGLMATFSSASAAIACAVAMQQGTERSNRGQEHRTGLRIGLSGGDIVSDDNDYFGDPVVEAARLCAKCDGGQILAAQVVRLMSGRHNPHPHRDLGPVELKGFAEPVEAVEILWQPLPPDAPERIPLVPPLVVQRATGMIGREPEMAEITDALDRVSSASKLEAVFISGEAGLGKTTLVTAAAQHAYASGAHVLFGHCEEDLARPYQLFAESLGHYVAHVDEEELLAHVAVHGSELLPLVPALSTRFPALPSSKATDVDTQRFLLFAAVADLLAAASADVPVVLVFDDLQWADGASLLLLRHLISSEMRGRILVLATYRPDELPQAHELRRTLGVLRRFDGVNRVDLGGLDEAGVASLMQTAAGHQLDAAGMELAHIVHRETDGNPFFVTELLRHLADTGAIRRDTTGHWVATTSIDELALPESVREVIGGRIARLGDTAGRVLSLAAVIGRDFDLELLACATGTDDDTLLDVLDNASAASLVRELNTSPGQFFFSHALIQRTIYNDLGITRRARAHRQIAEALERLCGGEPGSRVGQLARHWLLATQPSDISKAVRYSLEAGTSALRSLAPADAQRYFTQALELCEQDADVEVSTILELRIGLGIAQRQLGDPAYRDTLLEAADAARAIGDTEHMVAAALANNRGFYSAVGATDGKKVDLLEALAESLPTEHEGRALVLATLCSELAHGSSLERRQVLAEEAVALAEKHGSDETVVRVLNHLYIPLQVPHLLDVALERTEEALRLATALGDPALLYWASMWRAETAARSADIETMDRCLHIHGTTAERLHQPIFIWGNTFVRGLRAMIAGDTDAAERLATRAFEIGSESGQPDAGTIFGSQLLIVNGQRGTMSTLIPLIEKMASETPDISPWLFGSLLAKAHVEAGNNDEAIRLLDKFAAADFDLPLDQVWLTGMVDYADAAIEAESRAHAAPLFERLLPWAGQLPATGASALPPVSAYLGGLATVLGNFEQAETHFARAATLSRRMDAQFFCARNDLLWGRMFGARDDEGDRERASALLEKAEAAAARRGYGSVARNAAKSLEQLGLRS